AYEGRRLDSGKRRGLGANALEKPGPLLGLGELGGRQVDAHREQIPAVESRRDFGELREAPEQQSRAGQQHQAERHFRRDEGRRRPVRAGRSASGSPKDAFDLSTGGLPGRREPEDHARGQGEGQRKRENGRFDAAGGARKDSGYLTRKRIDDPDRAENAENRSSQGQDQALRQELTDQPPPPGSQRDAHGDLAVSAVGARQQQVSDVGTGDQQYEPGSAGQQQEHRAGLADDVRRQRQHFGTPALVEVGVRPVEVAADGVHLGPRGWERSV